MADIFRMSIGGRMPDAVRPPDAYGSNRIGTHGGSTVACDPPSDQEVIATQATQPKNRVSDTLSMCFEASYGTEICSDAWHSPQDVLSV